MRTVAPIIAALASLLWPGVGHAYHGRPMLAVALWFSAAALGLATVAALAKLPWTVGVALAIAWLAYRVWIARDAFRRSRHAGDGDGPSRRRRWTTALAFVAGVWAFNTFVTADTYHRIAEAYRIPTGGMEPTVLVGDYVFVTPASASSVERGALVVHQFPEDTTKHFIKRVVGVAGDTIAMTRGLLQVNGRAVPEPYAIHTEAGADPAWDEFAWQRTFLASPARESDYHPTRNSWGPLVIPAGHYFVLGDNRDNSYDSRYWGFLGAAQIVGRPRRVYFSRQRGGPVRWARIGRTLR